MSIALYVTLAFFLPFILIIGSLPVVMWMARNKNEAFARTHVQVCVLSDVVDKEYYQCDKPKGGKLSIILKDSKGQETGRKDIQGETFLDMHSHPSTYPPRGWRQVSAPIQEYYVTDSFVPHSLKKTDPLETASALFRLENEGVTAIVVHEAQSQADESKKVASSVNKSALQPILLASILGIVATGIAVFMIMRGNSAINAILEGLRQLGVIH